MTIAPPRTDRGIGAALPRDDAAAKAAGTFDYSSDLRRDGMLFGATVRAPHAAARIRHVDTRAAAAVDGVHAVLTHADVPGDPVVGSVLPDQPVLAHDEVRYHGEPVAIVAADDPATARHAASLVEVDYEVLDALTEVDAALAPDARALHAEGNALRRLTIHHGEPAAVPEDAVVVRGRYAVGMQDQAFLGPESGLAVPRADGGVTLWVATQWLHLDRDQVASALAVAPEDVHLELAGVGGAFGGREDLSMHVHVCLLALRTGRPVKMVYTREESFVGHVHRHPAALEYEHVADRDGHLLAVTARVTLDGGAYASSSPAVLSNAASLAFGPYVVPHGRVDAVVAYTNNPPCGAMRGFGAPQVAVGYEAQMDAVAAACGLDPVEVRLRNALPEGGLTATGQAVRGPVAVDELLARLRALPVPPPDEDPRAAPAGPFGGGAPEAHVIRAVGYAAGFKNLAFSEGFDDSTFARVRLVADADGAFAEVHTAATEVGQGVVGVQQQVVRSELGVEDVRVHVADTLVGSAGSASASRLTWMVSGALRDACADLRSRLPDEDVAAALAGGDLDVTGEATHHHAPTARLDERGQGDMHLAFAFVAHRAVVDVDVELGMARVVELACAQDVGRAINPLALEGQLQGASLQGLGLALSEEIRVRDGRVAAGGFSSYHIPTVADAPSMPTIILERAHPDAPYGVRGAGELGNISSTPAVVAALRAATGRALTRVPVRPSDLAG